MNAREREIAALVYLLALFPLWGILFDGVIWTIKKESSHKIVFHAHQAIVLHFMEGLFETTRVKAGPIHDNYERSATSDRS